MTDKPARVVANGYEASVLVGNVRLDGFDSSFDGCDPMALAQQKADEINTALRPLLLEACRKGIEAAVKVIKEHQEGFQTGNSERVVVKRTRGDVSGLGFADKIRSIKPEEVLGK